MRHSDIEVCSTQRLCVHDGPGIRTTVFMKGCYLRCPWCCNPETIGDSIEYLYNEDKCLLVQGVKSSLCRDCEQVGGIRKKEECPFNAYKLVTHFYSKEELLDILLEDRSLYKESLGGVTFSGGEPFVQAERIAPLLKVLKKEDIHVAVETSCYCPHESLVLLDGLVDLYIIDLKFQYGFIKSASSDYDYLDDFHVNIEYLRRQDKKRIFRMVYIPEALDSDRRRQDILHKLMFLRVSLLQLLPYHNLAISKYKQLGKHMTSFSMPTMEKMLEFKEFLEKNGITCEILNV